MSNLEMSLDMSFTSTYMRVDSLELLDSDCLSVIFSYLTPLENLLVKRTCRMWDGIINSYTPKSLSYSHPKLSYIRILEHLEQYVKNIEVIEDFEFHHFSLIMNYLSKSKGQCTNVSRISAVYKIHVPGLMIPVTNILRDGQNIEFLSRLNHSFPNVRILDLSAISQKFDPYAVCSVFQKLEKLSVSPVHVIMTKDVPHFPKLKKLDLVRSFGNDFHFLQLLIVYPNLETLIFVMRGSSPETTFVDNLEVIGGEKKSRIGSTLKTLKISLEPTEGHNKEALVNLLSNFRNLRHFTLCEQNNWRGRFMFKEYQIKSIICTFTKLETLKLKLRHDYTEDLIDFIIRESPKLGRLSLTNPTRRGGGVIVVMKKHQFAAIRKKYEGRCEIILDESPARQQGISDFSFFHKNRFDLNCVFHGANQALLDHKLQHLKYMTMTIRSQDDLVLQDFPCLKTCRLTIKNKKLRNLRILCPNMVVCEVSFHRRSPKISLALRSDVLERFTIHNPYKVLRLETPMLVKLNVWYNAESRYWRFDEKTIQKRFVPAAIVCDGLLTSLKNFVLPGLALLELAHPKFYHPLPVPDYVKGLTKIEITIRSLDDQKLIWETFQQLSCLKTLMVNYHSKGTSIGLEFPEDVTLFVENLHLRFPCRTHEFDPNDLCRVFPFVEHFEFCVRRCGEKYIRKLRDCFSSWDHLNSIKLDFQCRRDGFINEILNENNNKLKKVDVKLFNTRLNLFSNVLEELVIRSWCPWRHGAACTFYLPLLKVLRTNLDVVRRFTLNCPKLEHLVIDKAFTVDALLNFIEKLKKLSSVTKIKSIGFKGEERMSEFNFLTIQELFPQCLVYKVDEI